MGKQQKKLDLSLRGVVQWLIAQTINNLFIGIIILAILAVVTYFLSSPSNPLPPLSAPVDIVIYKECYHLGDVTRDWFCHPVPQTNPFERRFHIDQLGGSAYLQLSAKHVDPDEIKAPVRIYLNGEFIDFLNRYFEEETINPKTVDIVIPPNILHIGENGILIVDGTEVNQVYDVTGRIVWRCKAGINGGLPR